MPHSRWIKTIRGSSLIMWTPEHKFQYHNMVPNIEVWLKRKNVNGFSVG